MGPSRDVYLAVGRSLLGAVAGAVVCLTVVAVVCTALAYTPPDDWSGLPVFVLCVGFGGAAGATLAVLAGTREIRGRARDVALGTLVGCLLGLLGAVAYAALASGFSAGFLTGRLEAAYRWTGLCVGVPGSTLLGGVLGWVAGAVRDRRGGRSP